MTAFDSLLTGNLSSEMSGARMSPYELEGLFIEKLTQKYKLNERDIKRAFAHCDCDGKLPFPPFHPLFSHLIGNGLLSLQELTHAFERYLNGVDKRSIEELIARYDVNGDGQISFEEFYELLNRRDASKAPHPRSDPRNSKASRSKQKVEEPEEVQYTRPQHARRSANRPHPRKDEHSSGQSSDFLEHHGSKEHRSRRHRDDPDPVSVQEYGDDRRPYRQDVPGRQHRSSTDDYSEVSNLSDMSELQSDMSDIQSEMSDYHSEMPSEFDPNRAEDMESRVKVYMHNLKSYLLRDAILLRQEERVANRVLVHAQQLSENVGRSLILRAFERVSQSVGRDLVNFKSFQK
jgi:hypothetical protein